MGSIRRGLEPLHQPMVIRTDCIASQYTKLYVKQNLSWSNSDFTVKTDDGTVILTCNGKVWSNSARKEFKDASGLPLYSLRISWFSKSKAWRPELPGDGHVIMAVFLRWSFGRVKLDCSFTNAAADGGGQEILLEVRGQDSLHMVTHIFHGDKKVASVRRIIDNGRRGAQFMFKPEYKLMWRKGWIWHW